MKIFQTTKLVSESGHKITDIIKKEYRKITR